MMKQKLSTFTALSIAMIASVCIFSSCEKSDPTPIERADIPLTKSQQQIVDDGNAFAFNLFKEMNTADSESNLFISPLSASLAIAAVTNGADGETMSEMKSVLGFEEHTLNDMNGLYQTLVPSLKKVDNTTTVQIANAIWFNDGFNVLPSFTNVLNDYYSAKVQNLDFSSPSAVGTINKWCSDNTNRMIPTIIDRISSNTRFIYTNALYFKGIWATKFKKSDSVEDDFTTADGSKTRETYMNQKEDFLYAGVEDATVISMPYGNGAYSMVAILPDEGVSVDDFIAGLTLDKFNQYLSMMSTCEVDVKFPRFEIEYDSEDHMINVLKKMGMVNAFEPDAADFSNIDGKRDLFISMLKQKTKIKVNEEGTEAAAVTIIIGAVTSLGPRDQCTFHAVRPFIYAIREVSTGTILFMGVKKK